MDDSGWVICDYFIMTISVVWVTANIGQQIFRERLKKLLLLLLLLLLWKLWMSCINSVRNCEYSIFSKKYVY